MYFFLFGILTWQVLRVKSGSGGSISSSLAYRVSKSIDRYWGTPTGINTFVLVQKKDIYLSLKVTSNEHTASLTRGPGAASLNWENSYNQ